MGHVYTNLTYHIIFSTKDRHPFLDPALRPRFHQFLGGMVRGLGGIPWEVGGVADHVHLLVRLNQNHRIADFLRDVKANASKWANQSGLFKTRFEWQRGYAAFSVSKSQMEIVRRYIQRQEQHHQKLSFEEEFLAMLDAHEIAYERQYVFD